MRKMILGTCILALLSTMLLAQEEKFPGYSIIFADDRNSGTAVFESQAFDGVWEATIKALKSERYRIESSDKTNGVISAVRPDPWGQTHNLLGTEEHWDIALKAAEGDVRMTCVAKNMAAPQKAIRNLCKKIAKQLEKAEQS